LSRGTTEHIRFTAFGVPLEVIVPARLLVRALSLLPPGAASSDAGGAKATVAVQERDSYLEVTTQGRVVAVTEDDGLALGALDAQMRASVALLAPDHIFVHAGVVAVDDRAIVLPGSSFAGKTTLVQALVEAGATYYSDEFAVFDAAGLVHPYAKPLSIRHADLSRPPSETPAAALGGVTGKASVAVGLIAITVYAPGATLIPEPLPSVAALLAMLEHTIPARTRPQQVLAALKAAVRTATSWESDRGEAAQAARAIIDGLARSRRALRQR
jgi:hypothetical protein